MKMGQYELQSYFKSLCNSFYIAYRQVKRLERELEELKTTSREQGLKIIAMTRLLNGREIEEELQKYIPQKCSEKEYREEMERLPTLEWLQIDYERKRIELKMKCESWAELMEEDKDRIWSIIGRMTINDYSVIITSEAELYVLIAFYSTYSAKQYPIIKEEEQYKEEFFTEGTIYKDFLNAYHCDLQDEDSVTENMHEVRIKYF